MTEDIAPKSDLWQSFSRCVPALFDASQGVREAGGLSTAGWGLSRIIEPGLRGFLRDRLLPAVLDVSASGRGKLQTPAEVEFAGVRSAATHRHDLPLCK